MVILYYKHGIYKKYLGGFAMKKNRFVYVNYVFAF